MDCTLQTMKASPTSRSPRMDLGKAASSCLPHRHALRGAVALNKIAHHAPFTPEDIQEFFVPTSAAMQLSGGPLLLEEPTLKTTFVSCDSHSGLHMLRPAIHPLYALQEVALQGISVACQDSNIAAALSQMLLEQLSTFRLQEIVSEAVCNQNISKAAVVEQPDDQASQLALCYDAAADTEADAAAGAAAVPAEEPHLLTTVALFAAFTVLSCTGIHPWGFMFVKAVRRKLRPGQPRKGSWHAKYTHRPKNLPPRGPSKHEPFINLQRWRETGELFRRGPQPQEQEALLTEAQQWLAEASEPYAQETSCREQPSALPCEAKVWLDEAGFPPMEAEKHAPLYSALGECVAPEPARCEADRWLEEIGEQPSGQDIPLAVVKESCMAGFQGETAPSAAASRAGRAMRRFWGLFGRSA